MTVNPLDEIDTPRQEYQLTTSQKLIYLAFAAMLIIGSGFFFKLAIDPIGRDFA